ncbi:hypothetical protein SCLCIDRAFT_29258 [Scleroderma citrinum Foug A]|uniref:Uncharacterized protein n=1 Tax=Scleroderma citrinum Foug A TaxID=1036808 RepID=A0A0C3D7V2_9AGAM|nr:hypothetical protein SCLCIDRAFT_29258 [Scleroderma citrinum Foug A]
MSPPGPGFNYKKLKAGTLCKLVRPYLCRKLGLMYDRQTDDEEAQDSAKHSPEIEIKLWHKEIICIPDTNPMKGDVAIFRAMDGTVLGKIADDPEWQKVFQEGEEICQELAATQKKHGTSSPPSCKRLQTETTNKNGEGQQPPDLPMVPQDGLSNPLTLLVCAHTQPVGHGDVLLMCKRLRTEMTSNNVVGQQYPDLPMVPFDELANPPALPVHTCTQPDASHE